MDDHSPAADPVPPIGVADGYSDAEEPLRCPPENENRGEGVVDGRGEVLPYLGDGAPGVSGPPNSSG